MKSKSSMKLLLFGPPGAGKGTQGACIKNRLGIPHIASGDLIRAEIAAKTPLGLSMLNTQGGNFVPDEIAYNIIQPHIKDNESFVMDGYPRNLQQAQFYDTKQHTDHAIYLNVSKELLEERITGRRMCPDTHCKAAYHITMNPPLIDETCDNCDSQLYTRKDDTPQKFAKRHRIYLHETLPLLSHYASIVHEIDAGKSIEKVTQDIFTTLRI